MAKILVVKTLKELAKKYNKQVSKDFIEILDRQMYEKIETKILSVRQKRLTKHDFVV
jgi:oligoribonuclease (3'-5' exoribonuclease)